MVATHCLCHIHLHTAARIIAIKSMMFSVFKFCFLLFQLLYFSRSVQENERPEHGVVLRSYEWLLGFYENISLTFVELIACVFLSIVAMLLFYGNRQHKSQYYWPFTVFAICELGQAAFNLGYYVWRTLQLATTNDAADKIAPNERTAAITTCIILITLILLFYSIRTYIFVIVVWQARVYLTLLNKSGITSDHHMPSQVNLRQLDVQKSPGLLKS